MNTPEEEYTVVVELERDGKTVTVELTPEQARRCLEPVLSECCGAIIIFDQCDKCGKPYSPGRGEA